MTGQGKGFAFSCSLFNALRPDERAAVRSGHANGRRRFSVSEYDYYGYPDKLVKRSELGPDLVQRVPAAPTLRVEERK